MTKQTALSKFQQIWNKENLGKGINLLPSAIGKAAEAGEVARSWTPVSESEAALKGIGIKHLLPDIQRYWEPKHKTFLTPYSPPKENYQSSQVCSSIIYPWEPTHSPCLSCQGLKFSVPKIEYRISSSNQFFLVTSFSLHHQLNQSWKCKMISPWSSASAKHPVSLQGISRASMAGTKLKHSDRHLTHTSSLSLKLSCLLWGQGAEAQR